MEKYFPKIEQTLLKKYFSALPVEMQPKN